MSSHPHSLLREALPLLRVEYDFWMATDGTSAHAVPVTLRNGETAYLNRYVTSAAGPRPESYLEDLTTATHEDVSDGDRHNVYAEIAAAAESGWDFSSRWMEDGASLHSARTSEILPVDLNAIMCAHPYAACRMRPLHAGLSAAARRAICHCTQGCLPLHASHVAHSQMHAHAHATATVNAKCSLVTCCTSALASRHRFETNLHELHLMSGESATAITYAAAARTRRLAMSEVLWSESKRQWEDYHWPSASPVDRGPSASNWLPLWAGAYDDRQAKLAVTSLRRSGLVQKGGVATTSVQSDHQWDWPNAWAPLQEMLVEGLERTGTREGSDLALRIARCARPHARNANARMRPPLPHARRRPETQRLSVMCCLCACVLSGPGRRPTCAPTAGRTSCTKSTVQSSRARAAAGGSTRHRSASAGRMASRSRCSRGTAIGLRFDDDNTRFLRTVITE